MKQYVQAILLVFLLIFLAACGSDNHTSQEKVNENTTENKDSNGSTSKAKEPEQIKEVSKNAVLIEKLNNQLDAIMLPKKEEGYFPLANTVASYSDEQGFQVTLRLEKRTAEQDLHEGLPLNVSVSPYDEAQADSYLERGFKKENHQGKDFLVHPDPDKREIVFVEDGYLYDVNSSTDLINHNVTLFSIEELVEIVTTFEKDSNYKLYLKVDEINYEIPSYFMNDQAPNYISVFYSDFYSEKYNIENQSITLGNDYMSLSESMISYWAAENILSEEYYSLDHFTEIYINEGVGYLNPSEPYDFAAQLDTLQIYIAPRQEVNQRTGSVSTVKPENWEEEIRKVFQSFFDENGEKVSYTEEASVEPQNTSSEDAPELFAIEDQHFQLYGIKTGTFPYRVKELHGTPDFQGPDPDGFYDWIHEYSQHNLFVSFYQDEVDTISAEADLQALEQAINKHFNGDRYVTEDGTKYLYLKESEELFIYTKHPDDPTKVNVSILYADNNFHYNVESGWIKKVN